ncbi:MAG: D-aminoacyl-tRNA deacylase, partial [Calditrichota bacterium]
MRAVIQRVSKASVEIDNKLIGEIGSGFVVLLGITLDDDLDDAVYRANKTANLRVFEDDLGKMNVSLLEKRGEILAISQFTLYSDTRKGRRPSFIKAAPPEKAEPLYEYYIKYLK